MLSVKQILKKYKKAKSNQNEWRSHLQECYKYCIPYKEDQFNLNTDKGKRNKIDVYDSTSIIATQKYANRLHQQLTPPWREWAKLEVGSEIDEEQQDQIQPELDNVNKIIFDHINHSNFSNAIHESYMDVAVSTGALIVEEGDGIQSDLHFRAVPISELSFDQSKEGFIEDVYRTFSCEVGQIDNLYKDAKLNETLTQMLTDNPDAKIELLEAVVKVGASYEHTVIFEKESHVIYQQELEVSPYIIFREAVAPGETYGRGRALQLLPDIKTLNKIVEFTLRNLALTVSGVYTAVDDGVLNPYTIKLEPGAIIPIQRDGSLAPLQRSGDFNAGQIEIEQYKNLINDYMLSQPFGNLNETPVRTATEMSIRQADLQQTSVSAFGRFQTELLQRLIKRVVHILKKNGRIPELKIDGKQVTLKFTSPLAKQQDLEEISTLINFMGTVQQSGLDPQALSMAIKFEEIPRFVAKKLGIPSHLIRTKEEMEEVANNMKQQMEQQAQEGAPVEN